MTHLAVFLSLISLNGRPEPAVKTDAQIPESKPAQVITSDSIKPNVTPMQLGAFSISLAVKDIKASKAFYEKLGFKSFGGDVAQNWAILKNGDHIIGLFQGMFEKNMLTFNPGWDQNAQNVDPFADVRELQRQLKAAGVKLETEADEKTTGPAHFVVIDPDGNPILVDQHR